MLRGDMAKRPPTSFFADPNAGPFNPRLSEFLDDLEYQETPERLLHLARQLQDRVSEREQLKKPN
jgi:hypothetical protein